MGRLKFLRVLSGTDKLVTSEQFTLFPEAGTRKEHGQRVGRKDSVSKHEAADDYQCLRFSELFIIRAKYVGNNAWPLSFRSPHYRANS